MEKAIISIVSIFFSVIITAAIVNANTVSEDAYIDQRNNYEQKIANYQDYIRGLNQYVSADTINDQALEVLREKVDLEGND